MWISFWLLQPVQLSWLVPFEEIGVEVPVVVRLEGNNAELGRDVLQKSGFNIIAATSLSDAAKKVVTAAGVT